MSILVRLDLELAYFAVTVEYVNNNTKGIHPTHVVKEMNQTTGIERVHE